MIITEQVTVDGREFIKTTSDEGRYVVRDGANYEEAYDPVGYTRTYTEGDLIPQREITPEMIADMQRALAILGVTE